MAIFNNLDDNVNMYRGICRKLSRERKIVVFDIMKCVDFMTMVKSKTEVKSSLPLLKLYLTQAKGYACL